ncbi:ribonuclease E inhibitor RraB [Nocardioides caricicola]|uniref:Ribonuclease E inhibitor RraB n=1 Tax=Nocardioides caricicola TaxID=634770 RepID=A0ABW0N113_9ACTN
MGIFRRSKRPTPVLPSTGHPGDDQLIALIARDVGLDAVRDWVHYVYFAREETARAAALDIQGSGWEIRGVEPSPDRRWVVVAGRQVAALDPETVRDARSYFETLAGTRPRGEYDGWEVSVEAGP